MKKIILILIAIITLVSCNEITNTEQSIRNTESFTTVAMQQMPKDTVITAIKGNLVYAFNDSNNVAYVSRLCMPTDTVVSFSIIQLLAIFIVFSITILGIGITIGNS